MGKVRTVRSQETLNRLLGCGGKVERKAGRPATDLLREGDASVLSDVAFRVLDLSMHNESARGVLITRLTFQLLGTRHNLEVQTTSLCLNSSSIGSLNGSVFRELSSGLNAYLLGALGEIASTSMLREVRRVLRNVSATTVSFD